MNKDTEIIQSLLNENKELKDTIQDLEQKIVELELNDDDMPLRLEYEDLD